MKKFLALTLAIMFMVTLAPFALAALSEVTDITLDPVADLKEESAAVAPGKVVGTLAAVLDDDEGTGASYTYALVSGDDDDDNDAFVIDGTSLKVGITALTEGTYKFRVEVTYEDDEFSDTSALTFEKALTLTVGAKEDSGTTYYSVTFDANGGTGSHADLENQADGEVTLPTTTTFEPPSDKKFGGWTAVAGTLPVITSVTIDGADVTVFAYWVDEEDPEPGDTYTVNFDANGGSGSHADLENQADGEVTLPTTTTIEPPPGKKFGGWTKVADTLPVITTVTIDGDDVTVFAYWVDDEGPGEPEPLTPKERVDAAILLVPETIASITVVGGAGAENSVKASAIKAYLDGLEGMSELEVFIFVNANVVGGVWRVDARIYNSSVIVAQSDEKNVTVTEFVAPDGPIVPPDPSGDTLVAKDITKSTNTSLNAVVFNLTKEELDGDFASWKVDSGKWAAAASFDMEKFLKKGGALSISDATPDKGKIAEGSNEVAFTAVEKRGKAPKAKPFYTTSGTWTPYINVKAGSEEALTGKLDIAPMPVGDKTKAKEVKAESWISLADAQTAQLQPAFDSTANKATKITVYIKQPAGLIDGKYVPASAIGKITVASDAKPIALKPNYKKEELKVKEGDAVTVNGSPLPVLTKGIVDLKEVLTSSEVAVSAQRPATGAKPRTAMATVTLAPRADLPAGSFNSDGKGKFTALGDYEFRASDTAKWGKVPKTTGDYQVRIKNTAKFVKPNTYSDSAASATGTAKIVDGETDAVKFVLTITSAGGGPVDTRTDLSGNVTITGTVDFDGVLKPQVGKELTAKVIDYVVADVTYEWRVTTSVDGNSDFEVIPGETGHKYTPVPADVGKRISVLVTADATNESYKGSGSALTNLVAAADEDPEECSVAGCENEVCEHGEKCEEHCGDCDEIDPGTDPSDNADAKTITVKDVAADINGTNVTVTLPAETILSELEVADFDVETEDAGATSVVVKVNDGEWTVTITAEDGETEKVYTITITVAKATVNKAALETAIEEAETNLASVEVGDDASEVDEGTDMVSQTDYETYEAAIADAKAVLDDGEAEQEDVDKAVNDLADATTTFNNAKVPGTKDES